VNTNKRNAVLPVIKLLEAEPKAIVLLYESSQRHQSPGDISLTTACAADLKSIILSERDIAIARDEKKRLQQLRKVLFS
jgi:hypothetical protein